LKKETTIFVVDDDNSARNGITRLLLAAGYCVKAFASSKKFLESLGTVKSGFVLLDIRMPEISTEEFAKKLSENNTNLKIIVITADDSPGTRQKASDIKAIEFFRKPIDGNALLDTIGWALKRSENKNSCL
jgi:two-component system response regulator TtrR